MTEAEIIKALECCRDNDNNLNMEKCFDECPYKGECAGKFMADALDLIKRKNAEIELLENESKRQATKAIKEFTQRVRKYLLFTKCVNDEDINEIWRYLDQIAKEMGCVE